MSAKLDAGLAADIVPGSTRVVPLPPGANGMRREAIVLCDEQGELRAYVNRCQHLPIPLDGGGRAFFSADGRHLLCRTHGASYRLHDGLCVAGPCTGSSLVALRLERDGARVALVIDG